MRELIAVKNIKYKGKYRHQGQKFKIEEAEAERLLKQKAAVVPGSEAAYLEEKVAKYRSNYIKSKSK